MNIQFGQTYQINPKQGFMAQFNGARQLANVLAQHHVPAKTLGNLQQTVVTGDEFRRLEAVQAKWTLDLEQALHNTLVNPGAVSDADKNAVNALCDEEDAVQAEVLRKPPVLLNFDEATGQLVLDESASALPAEDLAEIQRVLQDQTLPKSEE